MAGPRECIMEKKRSFLQSYRFSLILLGSMVAGCLLGTLRPQWAGVVVYVVSGGIGTIIVVGAVALIWPQVRRYGKLT